MSHDDLQELLGVYAADAIDDPDERDDVRRHLGTCAICRAEVDAHREALAALVTGNDRGAPDSWATIAAALPGRPAGAGHPRPDGSTVLPFRRRARIVAWVAPVAAAAAAVLATLALTGGADLGRPVRNAVVEPVSRTSGVEGSVALYGTDRPDGVVVVDLRHVPEAPSGHHYEVWVLRPAKGEEMEPIGAFTPRDGAARLVLRLPGPGEVVAVDVSIQADGGSPAHSGTSLARALLS